jgi:ATP-dependent Clp protease ATP-binding subunit ClpA
VTITDDALQSAVDLSARFVTDTYMPDKAIDLIDEAASMAKLTCWTEANDMDELIRKQDAIDAINVWLYCDKDERMPADVIKALPPVQPQRMKGRWLPDNNCAYEMRFVCSVCKASEVVPTIGFTKYKPIWDFCPNCGAKMEG